MKPAHLLVMSLMALAIVVLFLALWETDYYPEGTLAPPGDPDPSMDPFAARLLPEQITHSCPKCGPCTHRLELLENSRTLKLRDHDGWYKLFWAADETYYYSDPVFLAAGLMNRTARDPVGFWLYRAKVGPATHATIEPHECTEITQEFKAVYQLLITETPLQEASKAVTPYLTLPVTAGMFAKRYEGLKHVPPVLHFAWRQGPEFDLGRPAPCPCGKP